jgi:hypothetical protein
MRLLTLPQRPRLAVLLDAAADVGFAAQDDGAQEEKPAW